MADPKRDHWIPARRYKHPDEMTLWERIKLRFPWSGWPQVSQQTADAEHRANPRMTAWTVAHLPTTEAEP